MGRPAGNSPQPTTSPSCIGDHVNPDTPESTWRRISNYYESNHRMISSPFGGIGSQKGPADPYFEEVLSRLSLNPRGRRVLEIGCGAGWFAAYCHSRASYYTGVDITKPSLLLTRQTDPRVARCDAHRLPFVSGSFDQIYIIDVFEHLVDQHIATAEFRRVLTPGGAVFLSVPNYSNTAGLVKKVMEWVGPSERDTWAPFAGWQPQELEQFITPGGVRRRFRSAGFSRFRMLGGHRDLLDGIFPWAGLSSMPGGRRIRTAFSRVAQPLAALLPSLSLHNFWRISER